MRVILLLKFIVVKGITALFFLKNDYFQLFPVVFLSKYGVYIRYHCFLKFFSMMPLVFKTKIRKSAVMLTTDLSNYSIARLSKSINSFSNFISYTLEESPLLFFCSFSLRWIIKSPMLTLNVWRCHRAFICGIAT